MSVGGGGRDRGLGNITDDKRRMSCKLAAEVGEEGQTKAFFGISSLTTLVECLSRNGQGQHTAHPAS